MGSRLMTVVLLTCTLSVALALHVEGDRAEAQAVAADQPVMYLDVQAGTWRRPRSMISFGIAPALRMKLSSSGFAVTEDPDRPHELTLTVQYREERGKRISANLYGTDITCLIRLSSAQGEPLESMLIHESPSYTDLATAPYVEVVEQLQTNPYFYFIGEIVRGWNQKLDSTGVLIQALDRHLEEERDRLPATPLDTLVSPAETFPDLDGHFAPMARQNAVEELGRLKDPRAIHVLERLIGDADPETRVHAVLALGEFDTAAVTPVLARVAKADSHAAVRHAASGVLTKRTVR
jgi:hypothetical protein